MTDISLFDYELPEELIAQHPLNKRDASKLMAVNMATGEIDHSIFFDLPDFLHSGDILVFNDSKVIRARLIGEKAGTGARIEIFLLRRLDDEKTKDEVWEALAKPAKRLRKGDKVFLGSEFCAEVTDKTSEGFVHVRLEYEGAFAEILDRYGHTPLPPYIRRKDEAADAARYQTVYAKDFGSAAAPTAGLHFTERLLGRLKEKGIETVFVTLHVGLGTFLPVQTDIIEKHKMHKERYVNGEEARKKINTAKAEGRRIICVGTTSLRTLESACIHDSERGVHIPEQNCEGDTDIYFYPGGRRFIAADGLVTNFHLPRSTLLMLVCAFYKREETLAAYREAIKKQYRFFSYGDAMLLL